MSDQTKPDYLKLRGESLEDVDWETPSQRAAALDILRLWPQTKTFREISRRTDWSPSHIRNVYEEYFEPAASRAESHHDLASADTEEEDPEAYRDGYRDGFEDGFEEALQLVRRGVIESSSAEAPAPTPER